MNTRRIDPHEKQLILAALHRAQLERYDGDSVVLRRALDVLAQEIEAKLTITKQDD